MKKAQFSSDLDQLHPMIEWIVAQISSLDFDASAVRKIELASEEAIVNIVRHAYKTRPGKIGLEVHLFPSHVEIVFLDNGPPFNPLIEGKKVNVKASLEEREEGGLGIFMIRKSMDDVRYERKNDENKLILVKKIRKNS